MNQALIYPAIAEIGLITYRDVKSGTNVNNPVAHLPMPSQYLSVAVVYGILAVIPDKYSRITALMGWGFVVATALNAFTPGATVAATNIGTTPSVVSNTAASSSSTKTSTTSSSGGVVGAIKNLFLYITPK